MPCRPNSFMKKFRKCTIAAADIGVPGAKAITAADHQEIGTGRTDAAAVTDNAMGSVGPTMGRDEAHQAIALYLPVRDHVILVLAANRPNRRRQISPNSVGRTVLSRDGTSCANLYPLAALFPAL